jgi:hypothetical protein
VGGVVFIDDFGLMIGDWDSGWVGLIGGRFVLGLAGWKPALCFFLAALQQ